MKKASFFVEKSINISPEAAWDIIGGVSGVDEWLGPITACRVEGNKRVCSTESGSFEENILKVDHERMEFHYEIPQQHMIPVQQVIGLMKVYKSAEGTARVFWSWDFEVADENEQVAKDTLAMLGQMGLEGIEQLALSKVA